VIVGVPKEIKVREYRVGLVPAGVHDLVRAGHGVLVERGAGVGSGISDEEYEAAGAQVVDGADGVWSRAEMVVKVKEPVPEEYARMQEGQLLFTYLHLAAVPPLAKALVERRVAAVAYETIQLTDGSLPLLRPMSEVAGRMAIQVGAWCLQKENRGKGVLLGGVPGVRRGRVVVLGAGVVGMNAARVALGMGADVVLLDVNLAKLAQAEDVFDGRVTTLYSDAHTIAAEVARADLVVGAVLVPGAKAPKLVTEEMIRRMSDGAVVVDVAVDQGGCIETARPTTHDDPTYVLHGVVHYCVANMPGAVARTSTYALTNTTIRYVLALADHGVAATLEDHALGRGVNVLGGQITHDAVARSLGEPWVPLEAAMASVGRQRRRPARPAAPAGSATH
jgi:alanine dehydrogenase